MKMKTTLIKAISIVGITLLFVVSIALAQGDGFISFGIRPTSAFEDRPESFSYFSYVLEPGSVIEDEALVINSGSVPITLDFYAADGITAQNGGTAFTNKGNLSTGGNKGVSEWLSFSIIEVSLDPGEEVLVPFTLTVPQDASPGQHIAGLVVEAPPSISGSGSAEEGEAQIVVAVVHRVGVAVVIDVPGPRQPGLEIVDAKLVQQNDEGAIFRVDLRNSGNIILSGVGFINISDSNGEELNLTPIELDSLLPGDTATFNFRIPIHLSDSDYLLDVAFIYEEGGSASLDGVIIKIRNGQPRLEEDTEDSLLPAVIEELAGTPGQSPNRLIALVIIGVVIIGVTIVGIVVLRKFRNY